MAKHSPLRLRLSGALVVGATAALLAAPVGGAGLISGVLGTNACSTGPASQAFGAWGDQSWYELAPNGGFESGAAGWTLAGGAQVVPGNETFDAAGPGGSSLALPDGSSATSGAVCIGGLSRDTLRLFVSNGGSGSSRLHVEVIYRGPTGTLGVLDGGYVTVGAGWQPTPVLLALQLPILGSSAVQVRLTAAGSGGAWQVDDVFVDPWASR